MTTRQTRRRGVVPLLVAGGLALTGACGKSGGSTDSAKPLPSLGAQAPGALDPSATPTSDPQTEINGSVKVDSAQFTDTAGFITFTTPTKEVSCSFIPSATISTVTCQPATVGYTVREQGSCPQGAPWGSTVQLTTEASWACGGDKIAATKVLNYGGRVDTQDFHCVSRPDGVTCLNLHTYHGFRMSPAFYTFF